MYEEKDNSTTIEDIENTENVKNEQAIEDISEEEMMEELSEETMKDSEKEISDTIAAGGLNRHSFWKIANSYPRLTKEEEIELGYKIKAGDKQAREKLINCNINVAIQIGVIWFRRIRDVAITVSLEDMIQDAIMGLVHAADLYNPEKDIKFSSYATHFCMQGVRKGLELNGRTIKIPMRTVNCAAAVKRTMNELHRVLDRDPTAEEVYEYCEHKFSVKRIKSYMEVIRNTRIYSLDASVQEAGGKYVSPEAKQEGDRTMAEEINASESGSEDEVFECIEHKEMTRLMYEAMNKVLDEREKLVMKLLYAMPASKQMTAAGTAGECMTYDAVAEMLAGKGYKNNTTGKRLTKEMIRSIKEKAIWKIREYMGVEVPEERRKVEERRININRLRTARKKFLREQKKAVVTTK